MGLTRWIGIVSLVLFAGSGYAQNADRVDSVSINVKQPQGQIKALQSGVNDGPLCFRGAIDLTKYYRALGIQLVRLHDVPWAYDNAIDINYIFPDWNADPDQASSYDFTLSDYYLKTITSLGIQMMYRLGYSAEYKTAIHHNGPPSSYRKWADVATHIVRHYNDGWDNGYHYNIRYWEIWNEPDGHSFWAGTPEQFDELYAQTTRALKRLDPSLTVGGPALADDLQFLEQFLRYMEIHHVPIDFVSWHIYAKNSKEVVAQADRIHQLMTQYGYGKSQSILDEWNYGPDNWKTLWDGSGSGLRYFTRMHNEVGAVFDAATLTRLQDAPVDVATYYTGTTLLFGLFTPDGTPQKNYFAFLAFKHLLDSPNRVAVEPFSDPDVTALAGISSDKLTIRILLTNRSERDKALQIHLENLPWDIKTRCKRLVISRQYNLQPDTAAKLIRPGKWTEKIARESVLLLTIQPAGGR